MFLPYPGDWKNIHCIFSHHSRTNSIIQYPNYCICPFKSCFSMLRKNQHTFKSLKQKKEKKKALTVFTVVVWMLEKKECIEAHVKEIQKSIDYFYIVWTLGLQKEEKRGCSSPNKRKTKKALSVCTVVVWMLGLQKEEGGGSPSPGQQSNMGSQPQPQQHWYLCHWHLLGWVHLLQEPGLQCQDLPVCVSRYSSSLLFVGGSSS